MNLEKRKITLNETEKKICEYLAKSRYSCARENNVHNGKIGPQSNWETDLNGIGSEFAFCKMINVYPDLSIYPRKGGHDCLTHKNKTINVKSTKYKNGRLLTKMDTDPKDSDYFVLMVGEFPTYEFRGFIESEELIKKENIIDLGHGPGYGVEQKRLKTA